MILETIILGMQAGFGAAIIRNVIGYTKKMLEDGVVTKYELAMLGATVLSNVFYATMFILMGLDVVTAVGLSALTDVGVSAISKK